MNGIGVMTRDPAYSLPGDTVDKAAQLMKDEDVGAIPVVADHETKRLLGIVTGRDLRCAVFPWLMTETGWWESSRRRT